MKLEFVNKCQGKCTIRICVSICGNNMSGTKALHTCMYE